MGSSSACNRLMQRASSSSVRSAVARTTCTTSSPSCCRINSASSPLPNRSAATSLLRRFYSSRSAAELGCVQSLLPLHSAVAVATSCLSAASRSCRALSQGKEGCSHSQPLCMDSIMWGLDDEEKKSLLS